MFFLYCLGFLFLGQLSNAKSTFYLEPEDVIRHSQIEPRFQIFCYRGKPKYIINLWQTVNLQINLTNDNYAIYDGTSPEEVDKEYQEDRSSWRFSLFSWKQKQFKLDPFNQSCIGISSSESYTVHLNIIRIDYWKVLRLILGIFLFISAQKLSRNSLFYYICGISFGICASFLILIYFLSKLFPRKPMMYGVAVCGWTVGVYILQLLWENIRLVLVSYQIYVAWYALITGVVSFVVCYRMGPVENKRTLNLIQWSLQLCAMILIFFSSHFQEAAMGQIIFLVLFYNFPKRWLVKSQVFWKTKFPPKVKPLSNDEYYQQGVRETTKALDDLRKYCSSPDCNQWKTVLKLNNSKRFASFVEGTSHLSDEEILEYETSTRENEFTDDEEEYTDDEY